MAISRSAKDYVTSRIRRIARDAIDSICPTKQPCLFTFIRASILEGTAKTLTAKVIIEQARQSLIGCGTIDPRFELDDLFAVPQTYKDALKQFEDEQKATEQRRIDINQFADSVVDDLMLDQFEKGQDAIEKMMEFVKSK